MSHYERRLEQDLERIHARVAEVVERVQVALTDATRAALTHDLALASLTILRDLPVNRAIRELDRLCHAFVARHLPSAKHLRVVSSVLRLNIAIERIGDYAVTVARETVQLDRVPPPEVARDIEMISEQSRRMLAQAMEAFNTDNAELARGTRAMGEQVHSTFVKTFEDLLAYGDQHRSDIQLKELFAWLVIMNRYERVSDQAKNICEETVFAQTGQRKLPKVYGVMFVDKTNARASQLAEALARKAYPESGRYRSAGWSPAANVEPELVAYATQRGLDLTAAQPRRLDPALDDLHVVVALEPGARERLPQLPFRTVLLEWQPPSDGNLEELRRFLSSELQELMELLRGEGAN